MAYLDRLVFFASLLLSFTSHVVTATQKAVETTSSSPTLWYFTRAMAVSAYLALSLSVILGMLRAVARKASERLSWVVDELHQFIATLAGFFVVGHLLTLKLDPFMPFSLVNLLLPVAEPYKPMAVAFGVFGLYAMVLLLASSWLRRRIRYSWWRGIHYVSFVAFALVTLHGWLAGSDSGEPWMRAIYAASAASVIFLILVRLFVGAPSVSASSRAG
jgi:methionine sulfoxide reductase heme-binding subunit